MTQDKCGVQHQVAMFVNMALSICLCTSTKETPISTRGQ